MKWVEGPRNIFGSLMEILHPENPDLRLPAAGFTSDGASVMISPKWSLGEVEKSTQSYFRLTVHHIDLFWLLKGKESCLMMLRKRFLILCFSFKTALSDVMNSKRWSNLIVLMYKPSSITRCGLADCVHSCQVSASDNRDGYFCDREIC